jgi:heme/copper-type cytochrome/quinol oxidase subunit 3
MSVAHSGQVLVLEEHGQEGEHGLNWWGMMFFLASEALIFANFIATYLYLEIQNMPKMGSWQLGNVVTPLIFTIVLISSSGTVHLAGMAIRKGNMRAYTLWLALTIVLGIIFLGGQVTEYINLVTEEHFTLSSSIFGSSFFTLTGFHGGHVTIGALFLLIVLIRALRGDFTPNNHFAATAAELYWHFVDIVWIFVFTLIYVVPFFLPAPIKP